MKMASARIPYHACVQIMTCDFVLICQQPCDLLFEEHASVYSKADIYHSSTVQYIENHSPKRVEFKVVWVQPHKHPLVWKNKGTRSCNETVIPMKMMNPMCTHKGERSRLMK